MGVQIVLSGEYMVYSAGSTSCITGITLLVSEYKYIIMKHVYVMAGAQVCYLWEYKLRPKKVR